MTAATIAQLIIVLGPTALDLIPKLHAVWSKPELTPEEVLELCSVAKKRYDDYMAEGRAAALAGNASRP